MLCIFISPELELEGSDDLPKVTQGMGSTFEEGIHTCKAPFKAAFLFLMLCIFSYFSPASYEEKGAEAGCQCCCIVVLSWLSWGMWKNNSWAETQVRKVWFYPSGQKMSPCCSSHYEGGGSSLHTTSLLPGIFLCLWVLFPTAPFLPPPPWSCSPDVPRAQQGLLTLTFININTSAEDAIMKTICRTKMRSKAVWISYQ